MGNKWNEIYPRPQLRRNEWLGLCGEWRFRTARAASSGEDSEWEIINVPFCPESRLSGISRRIAPGEKMIYERDFTLPEGWDDMDIILNFGAVDQIAEVYIDGKAAGSHEGGYLPFSMDITELLEGGSDSESTIHTLRVEATDDLDHSYPWGKQKRKNGGMWYTPVSGIWQGVWMEPVHKEHITSLRIDCGPEWVEIRAYGVSDGIITLLGEQHRMAGEETPGGRCASIHIDIGHPRNWSPEDPYLYTFTIETGSGDRIDSYFALRTLTIEERDGCKRLCLNGKPYFFNGLLDQGYWQDGIYTPESPDKYAGDILAMKSLGFNTLRKHIKIENEQFYYDCDRLGMVVFQDMVNNGDYSFLRDSVLPTIGFSSRSDRNAHKGKSREIFLRSMDETVKHLYNHPSVCYWTIFNEGWGQFNADEAYERLRASDSSRFIDSTSGWFRQSKSDVDSHHIYFRTVDLAASDRPLVLTEFGGYACKLPDHCFNKDKTYGYRKCENEAALLRDIVKLYENEILPLREKGLCAAIYTQLSDVEDETNGILTYDREILKFRSYKGAECIEIIGTHTEHQGGKVIAAALPDAISAYVAENHADHIRITLEGAEPFEVSITDRTLFEKGTYRALVTGILEGFIDLFGKLDAEGGGFDAYIRSRDAAGSRQGSYAAFEMLICSIVNDRYFGGRAGALELAKIAVFAEREYFGASRGMTDQLAIGLGRMAMIDYSGREPEIELLDHVSDADGLEAGITAAWRDARDACNDPEALAGEYHAAAEDMFAVAHALGVSRLGDINEEQFRRKLPELEKLASRGELTRLQIDRAAHFYDENERALAASVALKTGNTGRFLQCIEESSQSSERVFGKSSFDGAKAAGGGR